MTDAGDLDRAQIMWGKWHRGDLLRHSAVWGWWRCARSRWGWACCLPMIRWQMDSDARQDRPATPPTNGSCCCWEETGGAELRKGFLQIFWWFSTEIIWLLVQILFQRGKTNLLRGEAVKRSRWSGSTCFFHPSNGLTHPNPITFTIHFANGALSFFSDILQRRSGRVLKFLSTQRNKFTRTYSWRVL